MKYEKFLPIGSIVLLQSGKHRIMITGFCYVDKRDRSKTYDYIGCLYPEGVVDSQKVIMFNHDQIDKIYFMGLIDEEEKKFKSEIVNMMKDFVKNK